MIRRAHLVVALTGTLVRLRSDDGTEAVVLAAYLMASPEFAVVGSDPPPAVEPFGLLDGLPAKVLENAREWERHLVEVETGLPPDPPEGATPRPAYDPATTTVSERERAKAAELGVGLRTIQIRRSRYRLRMILWSPGIPRVLRPTTPTRPPGPAKTRALVVTKWPAECSARRCGRGVRSQFPSRASRVLRSSASLELAPRFLGRLNR
jgi:hypothetical protein